MNRSGNGGGRRGSKPPPDGLPPLRDVIDEFDLRAKRSLGQNFILDLNLTRRIARVGGSLAGRTVVEIGPGPGGLTRALLLEGAKAVLAVERDERCLGALEQIAKHYPGRLHVHFADALTVDWPRALEDAGLGRDASVSKATIIANLPYNIASGLLVRWLETDPWPPWFDRLVLMFQREVADRIVAEPNSKAYGRLAVLSQWRCDARIALTLKPDAFTPPPKVASAVVELVPRSGPSPHCDVKHLGQVTAAAFGQRRKMLRQSLKTLTVAPELLLAEAGLSPKLRAENLSVADFAKLAAVIGRGGSAD